MDGTTLATLVAGIGGWITAVGTLAISLRQENRRFVAYEHRQRIDDFELLKETMRGEIASLKQKVGELEDLNRRLETRIMHMEALANHELPLPRWIKDRQGRYQWVNEAYVQMLLEPAGKSSLDILGKLDDEVWSPALAETLRAIDSRVVRSTARRAIQTQVKFDEHVPGSFIIFKWPNQIGATPIGWAGLAIPETDG